MANDRNQWQREEFEARKANLWRKRAMESIAAKAPAPAATAEKVLKKTSAKASVQKGKILEVVKEVPLDPKAEKLRQERFLKDPSAIKMFLLVFDKPVAPTSELLKKFRTYSVSMKMKEYQAGADWAGKGNFGFK